MTPLHPNDLLNWTYYRGRVGLYSLLKALGIGEGDDVLLQAYTCVANPEAIQATGARPVYVDCLKEGYTMCPDSLRSSITPNTRAIVVQHTFGIPSQMGPIMNAAKEHNIPVIEDCCHTLQSKYKGRLCGQFGIGTYYSFEWGKPLVAGIGGALTLNNTALKSKLEESQKQLTTPPLLLDLRLSLQYLAHSFLYKPQWYWPVRKLYHTLGKSGLAESNYYPPSADQCPKDYNWSMAKRTFKRLESKLRKLSEINNYSQKVSSAYTKEVNNPKLIHPECSPESVYARYPLRVPDKEEFIAYAREHSVEAASWYSTPIHPLNKKQAERMNYESGSCPNAESRCRDTVHLPTHQAVSAAYLKKSINLLNAYDA